MRIVLTPVPRDTLDADIVAAERELHDTWRDIAAGIERHRLSLQHQRALLRRK